MHIARKGGILRMSRYIAARAIFGGALIVPYRWMRGSGMGGAENG